MTYLSRIVVFLLPITLIGVSVGIVTAQGGQEKTSVLESEKQKDDDDVYRKLQLFGDAFEQARSHYVEKVDDEKLIYAAINGMLQSLDPHSGFLDPTAFDDIKLVTTGEFGGLGIEVTMEDGLVLVIAPLDGTPAAKAGIKSADRIAEIDGQQVFGMTLNEAVQHMRGEAGTSITMQILREGSNPLSITLTREVIKISPVRARLEGNVGVIRITIFNEKTFEKTSQAVADFRKEVGDRLQGIVIDLRNTPGGLLEQAIAVSNAFLNQGEIVSTRGRDGADAQRFNARPGDLVEGLPLIVLINGGSASASEIVAGALQDHHRAIIMGEQSFGKGSVQTILPLDSKTALRLTTARYYSPSGRSIQLSGVTPDIKVPEAKIVIGDASTIRREKDLRGALSTLAKKPPKKEGPKNDPKNDAKNDKQEDANKATDTKEKKALDTIGEQSEAKDQDYQMLRALELIKALSLVKQHSQSP